MKIALSPCPNDTYLFWGWIQRKIDTPLHAEPFFADVELLNEKAFESAFCLTKLSFHAFSKLTSQYQLLPMGAALGFGCGPLLIAKTLFPLHELPNKRVAIPGQWTTAHLLYNRYFSQTDQKIFCLYHEIQGLIDKGDVDCGLIIHESRFTFKKLGFTELADLGQLWYQETQLPLPLGGLAIKRSQDNPTKIKILHALQSSINVVKGRFEEAYPFILSHAQEKEERVIRRHIQTYVNKESDLLSPLGIKAIETLIGLPACQWLYDGT